ncbi:MAG: hypothetical protein SFU25_04310, partial [Candidatus Caenarcaniphilales bacterium]|nr:hypothetical protein [Candidatus Caenarcaniphilales bacterium]
MENLFWILLTLWFLFSVFLVWLVGFTEFSYFGNRGIKFLYNLFSPIYNLKWLGKKYNSPKIKEELFLRPLEKHLAQIENLKALD